MAISPKLQLKVKQTTQLAPQVRYAIRLMALTRLQLTQHIKQLAETNPLVDIELEPPIEVEPFNTGQSDFNSDLTQWAHVAPSLRDHLHWQASLLRLSARDHAILSDLIDHIDDRGLLTASVEEATLALQKLHPHWDVLQSDVETMLTQLQQLDPIGVGATSIEHSLRLQLKSRYRQHPQSRLADELINSHFKALGTVSPEALATRLGTPLATLLQAYALIQSLDPYPGSGFGQLESHHITPDVFIYPDPRQPNAWQVALNGAHLPKVSINDTYQQLIRQAKGSDKTYLQEKYQEASALLSALALRHQTLGRVTQALVAYQAGFLTDGSAALKPLTQGMVATELGMHVSTISRTTRGKYAQTPKGLVELKAFFSRPIGHQHKGAVAAKAVQASIASMIETEDHSRPLSDQAIATRLEHKGVKIARRTVTKYREQMGIGDSLQRRHQASWNATAAS